MPDQEAAEIPAAADAAASVEVAAPVPAPAPPAALVHALEGAALGSVITADHADVPVGTTLEKVATGIKITMPVPAAHQSRLGSMFTTVEKDVVSAIAAAKQFFDVHVLGHTPPAAT